MGDVSPPGGAEPGSGVPGELAVAAPGTAGQASSNWSRRIVLIAAALIAVGAVATVAVAFEPRPDATLRLTGEVIDPQVVDILARTRAEVDTSTLRAYEPYRGLPVFSATSVYGARCLLAIDLAGEGDTAGTSCIPEPAELYTDITLPDGARGRLVFAGDTIEVFEYLPEAVG